MHYRFDFNNMPVFLQRVASASIVCLHIPILGDANASQ